MAFAAGCSEDRKEDEAEATSLAEPAPVAEQTALADAAPLFDADNNGLYDDAERKILLDEFLRVSPELSEIIRQNSAPVYKAKTNNAIASDAFDENADKSAGADIPDPPAVVNFDADGDGKVTIEEMNKGHEPLSMLMPPGFLESGVKI